MLTYLIVRPNSAHLKNILKMSSPKRAAILTSRAPPPRPSNSQAIIVNGLIFSSGALGVDPATKKAVQGRIGKRAEQALRNLEAILEEGGSSLSHVVKCTVFLTDMANFNEVNKVYEEVFSQTNPRPSRTCVAVKQLPTGTDVEIECIAVIPNTIKL